MANDKNLITEQFRALRDEIQRCESESLRITLFAFTGTLVAAGLAEKPWLPRLIVPALFQIILIWGMHRYYELSMIRLRLSTFIEVMIEPDINEFNWETLNAKFHIHCRVFDSNILLDWILRKLGHLFFLLTALGLYLTATELAITKGLSIYSFLFISLALAFLHVISGLLMVKCTFSKPRHDDYVAAWKEIKEERNIGSVSRED